jgi:hypothetical protein
MRGIFGLFSIAQVAREQPMKLWPRLAAVVMLSSLPAIVCAQAPSEKTAPPPAARVNLTIEDRHVIKEILKEMKVGNAPQDVKLEVGSKLPPSVELQSLPTEISAKVPQIKSHKFFVKDGRVAIVSPTDNEIVEVLD